MSGTGTADVGRERTSRFFDHDRNRITCTGDVETFVFGPAEWLFVDLHRIRLFNRCEGYLRLGDSNTGEVLGTRVIGDESTWAYDYRSVVRDKRRLFEDAASSSVEALALGGVTRYAQLMGTPLLRGYHTVYYGTYTQDGVEVEFSGVQEVCDDGFVRIVYALYKTICDVRAVQLRQVCDALDFDTYAQAMDKIEEVAEEYGLTSVEAAVARILDDATLMRAIAITQQRHAKGER